MDIVKLYNMQKELDARIIKQHGLEGQDLLPQKILALQVELGECANEWRGFKYWSKDQQPRTLKVHSDRDAYLETNPLLEEYIDCLHFILSIGLIDDLYENLGEIEPTVCDNVTQCFNRVFMAIVDVSEDFDAFEYQTLLDFFFGLGKMLGFSWEQIEEAYMSKNETNHKRQDTGY